MKTKEEKRVYNKKYRQKHRKESRAYNKKWYQEHKEERRAYSKKHRQKHKEKISAYDRKYYQKHKEELRAYKKKYNQEHREDGRTRKKKYRLRRREEWLSYFPKDPICQICGKDLVYFGRSQKLKNFVCFDHKTNAKPIKKRPSHWLEGHFPTPENIKIWESYNFGVLCNYCNIRRRLKDSIKWAEGLLRYENLIEAEKK